MSVTKVKEEKVVTKKKEPKKFDIVGIKKIPSTLATLQQHIVDKGMTAVEFLKDVQSKLVTKTPAKDKSTIMELLQRYCDETEFYVGEKEVVARMVTKCLNVDVMTVIFQVNRYSLQVTKNGKKSTMYVEVLKGKKKTDPIKMMYGIGNFEIGELKDDQG